MVKVSHAINHSATEAVITFTYIIIHCSLPLINPRWHGPPLVKAKVGCLYGRSNILLRKFYFCSERVKNRLFSSYCSNLYLCSLWVKYRKASIRHFVVSYNNAYRILHSLPMSCSASFMFANADVDNCTTRVKKIIFSLLGGLTASTKQM